MARRVKSKSTGTYVTRQLALDFFEQHRRTTKRTGLAAARMIERESNSNAR
jgi:hypothetical protein